MHILIVTPSAMLSVSLAMVVAALAEIEPVTARDCAAARALAWVRRPDVALIDGRLPASEVLSLVEELGGLTPPVRRVVLAGWGTRAEELAAAEAELIDLEALPASGLFAALAEVVSHASGAENCAPVAG